MDGEPGEVEPSQIAKQNSDKIAPINWKYRSELKLKERRDVRE